MQMYKVQTLFATLTVASSFRSVGPQQGSSPGEHGKCAAVSVPATYLWRFLSVDKDFEAKCFQSKALQFNLYSCCLVYNSFSRPDCSFVLIFNLFEF